MGTNKLVTMLQARANDKPEQLAELMGKVKLWTSWWVWEGQNLDKDLEGVR